MADAVDDFGNHSGDRGDRVPAAWAVLICKIRGQHDWQAHQGMTQINFRVCSRCGETGWEL